MLMAWLYQRWLDRRITDRHPVPTEEFVNATGEGLTLEIRTAADVAAAPIGQAASRARNEAMRVTARVHLAYVAAWLVYATAITSIFIHYLRPGFRLDGKIAIAYALLAPQALIVMWAIRVPLRRRWLVFLIYTIVGIVLAMRSERTVLILTYVPVPLVLLPISGLLILFVRRLQPFLSFLLAIFGVFGGIAATYDRHWPESANKILEMLKANPWLATISLAGIVVGIVVMFALPRMRWRFRLSLMLIVAAGMLLLERQLTHRQLTIFLQVLFLFFLPILELCVLWTLCKVFVWLQGRRTVTNDLIHTHLCWSFFSAFLLAITLAPFYRDVMAVRWAFVFAFLLHIVALHGFLEFLRRQRPQSPEHRLLLLRAFGHADKHEALLDDLNDTWRRIGSVDLIAATDVTSRTLGSAMLDAFVLRHSDEEFLRLCAIAGG
jgi:hypothetical protein